MRDIKSIKHIWLLGHGRWGHCLETVLRKFDLEVKVLDSRYGTGINDIDDLEPVMIATPAVLHQQQCLDLLQRGHDVYVEKPMAQSAKEILDLRTVCRPEQIFMVGHLFWYHPQLEEIQTIIRTGFIGDLRHLDSSRLNWGTYQSDIDPMRSIGVHDASILDAMSEHTPRMTQVQRYWICDNLVPDRIVCSGQAGAMSFRLDVSWAWPQKVRRTVFFGSCGQIIWDQDINQYTITRHHVRHQQALIDPKPEIVTYQSRWDPLQHEIQHWLTCVRTRQPCRTGVNQALAVANIIDQMDLL